MNALAPAETPLNLITSLLRWGVVGALMLAWYPALIAASYVFPMARLNRIACACFRLSMRILGARLVVRGAEHLDPARGYLYLGNHVNLFDPFAFVSAAPHHVVALERRRNFRIPVYGWLIARWGNIPIERDDPTAAMKTLDEVAQRLARGESICVMPEGTRTRDGAMGEFKTGPFRVAIDAKALVVPFALRNMRRFNRTGSLRVHPCEVEVVFMPPIDAGAYDRLDMQALSDEVRERMQAALEAPEGRV